MINCAGLIHFHTTKEMKPFLATNKGKNKRQGIEDLKIICIVNSPENIEPQNSFTVRMVARLLTSWTRSCGYSSASRWSAAQPPA